MSDRGGETQGELEAVRRDDADVPTRDYAGALHEVSNALTVVLGWIGRARDASDVPPEVGRALAVAATRASQARDIVRRASGAGVPVDQPVAAGAVVRDAVLGLEPEARRAGLEVGSYVGADAELVAVQHASIALQILTNLLLNAIAVSPSGGLVRIDARV